MPLKLDSRKPLSMRPKFSNAASLLLMLCTLAAVVASSGARLAPVEARAASVAQQSEDEAKQRKGERPKRVVVGGSTETQQGTRQTIKSDNPLNDYEAYRSGDRFYVVLPKADANSVGRGAKGRGFSDMRVQQRGDDVVLSYRVNPGAKPRVEQKFNRLDVIFDVPESSEAATGAASRQSSQPSGASGQRAGAEPRQQSGQQPARTQNAEGASAPAPPAQTGTQGTESPVESAATQPVVTQEPVGAPAPAETNGGASPQAAEQLPEQIAQAPASNEPVAPAPISPVVPAQPSGVGAVVLNNWPLVLITGLLLLIGIGLLVSTRRASAGAAHDAALGDDAPISVAALPKSEGANGAGEALLASSPATTTSAIPVSLKSEGSKKKKRGSKAKGARADEAQGAPVSVRAEDELSDATLVRAKVASETTAVDEKRAGEGVEPDEASASVEGRTSVVASSADAVAEQPSGVDSETERGVAVEKVDATEHVKAATEPVVEAATRDSVGRAGASEAGAASETAGPVEASSETEPLMVGSEIEPLVALDPDNVQTETSRVLDGETYDKRVLDTSDAIARQMISAELLSALAGRNADRRERARAAFIEHGYFDETVRDLRDASAPAERASAARSLGLVGDRKATPHLIAALDDPSVEVRRAAVESLATLRDPSATGPLELLLEREKNQRLKVNRKLVQRAIEASREGATMFESSPAPQVEAAATAVEMEDEPAGEEVSAHERDEVALADVEAADETGAGGVAGVGEVGDVEATTGSVETSIVPLVESELSAPVEEVKATSNLAEAHAEDAAALAIEEPQAATASATLFDGEPEVASPGELGEANEADDETTLVTERVEPVAEVAPEVKELSSFKGSSEAEESKVSASEEAFASPAPEVESPAVEGFVDESAFAEDETPTVEVLPASAVVEEARQTRDAVHEATPPVDVEDRTGAVEGEWVEFSLDEPAEETKAIVSAEVSSTVEPAASTSEPSGEASPSSSDIVPVVESQPESSPVSAAFTSGDIRREVPPATEASGHEVAEEVEAEERPQAVETETQGEKGIELFDEHSTVPASIQQRLGSREPVERAAAIEELGRVDSDESFRKICSAFDDEAKEVRNAAARALFELRDDRAESFTRALRESTPERRRQIGAAINASGLAGDAISQLTGESREKTYEAFSLLFLMAKAGEVQPLIRAIEGHPNNEVRTAVVKLLALSGQKEVLPAFRRLAVRGSLPNDVRSAVMEAIYQLSSQQEPTHSA